MKTYTNKAVDILIDHWQNELCGKVNIVIEGCLASVGLAVLTKEGYKTIIIKEVYLNEWSSAQSVRKYNRIPAKYKNI